MAYEEPSATDDGSALRYASQSLRSALIWRTTSEVYELCEYAANVVMVIEEHMQKVPQSSLEKTLSALKTTQAEISRAIELWANYGSAMAFLKNDEILADIRKYRSGLAEALSMLSLQQLLNQGYWNRRFEQAGEADEAVLLNISNSIAGLRQRMDQMQQYFANYRPDSRDDPDGSQLGKVRAELFALRNEKKDEPVLPKREIKGEVQIIGSRPAHAGSKYDIWRGVWLGEYSVALKVLRGLNMKKRNTDRMNRQIDLWMSMRHPNILRLYGVCILDKGPNPPIYLVSPWMKNRDAVMYCKYNPNADRLRLSVREVLDFSPRYYFNPGSPGIPFYKIKAMGQLVVGITLRNLRPERADYDAPDITDPLWGLFVDCWKPAEQRPTVNRILEVVGTERQTRKGWIMEAETLEAEQDTEYPRAF
ncbi:hypothetical protein M407DRAFT_222252 [Tulasnella calospora MUT 4182]|uniref:Tyrosine-protein kinase catalytic domain-containing protein n=1 Tax=Tulasnella calospora MUT 4182 TaxID=1051891 RepID=A0A0C3LE67_9AGAM|nr:hypothetical protein M407DRAFT_222252 [Tulasnella calospora MUT 4182]